MPYTRRPFQPETPYVNQVSIELNKANDNFDILAQAFVSDNPETFNVKNSDKLDGFHASLTPAPNVIVPLNSAGILDLSATYVKSNVYTFRRVNLTGATSDYELQVGEEAYIEFSDATSVPLRIATSSGTLYKCIISAGSYNTELPSSFINLLPNNTTYSSQFYLVISLSSHTYSADLGEYVTLTRRYTNKSNFELIGHFNTFYINNNNTMKIILFNGYNYGNNTYPYTEYSGVSIWLDMTIPWTSLGTITFPQSISGYILVRRLR